MKIIIPILFVLVSLSLSAVGQKGIDSQTQKIKEDTNKTTSRGSDATRSFDWGRGKTRVRERLANPYVLNGRRDVLVNIIVSTLRENKFVVDEQSSRLSEGIVITQPFNIGRGPVRTPSELKRYGIVEFADNAWSLGQYSLVIEVQPIDGTRNNVTVNAKVEGRSGNGLMTEWVTLRSSGLAEDEFLAKLIEAVTGVSPDPQNEEIDQ